MKNRTARPVFSSKKTRLLNLALLLVCVLSVQASLAQEEALHGTWEGTISDEEGEATIRLTFAIDGTYTYEGTWQDAAFLEDFFDFTGTSELHHTGTYRVDGDSLWFDIDNAHFVVDGEKLELLDFMIRLLRSMAALFAEELEVSDEDYPAFEQGIVDEFLAEFDEEEMLAEAELGMSGTYAVERDILYLTEEKEVVLELHRIDGATTIARTTWGELKAAQRRNFP